MKVEFYRTFLCPRCLLVARELKKMERQCPELEIERIEVTAHPGRTWEAGVRAVPALRIGNDILTGLVLTPTKIRSFLNAHAKPPE